MNTTDALNRFENLPFHVEAGLNGFELSVRELLELKPGIVLETNHPAGAPLTLRAGGAALASAEIVLVEDALSVRIRDFCATGKAVQATN